MATYVAEKGEFTRDTNYITTRITADEIGRASCRERVCR